MKKSIITFVLLLAVTALNAQTLIKAGFTKGDKAVYETVADIKMAMPMGGGTEQIKTSSKTHFTVKEAAADGYVIEVLTTDTRIEGKQDLIQQTGNMMNQYLNDVAMVIKTDKNGEPKDLMNYEEVQTKVSRFAMAFIDSLYKAKPEMEKAIPKYKMAMSMNSLFTKEAFIETVKTNTFFDLFGKTLKTGDKENQDMQGIKAVVTYEISKEADMLNVVGKFKSNMTEADVKAFLIDKMKKTGADETMTAQIDNNWDRMRQMGMTNMDFNGTAKTHLLSTGWATDYSVDAKTKLMGMEMTTTSVAKLTEHSWKQETE